MSLDGAFSKLGRHIQTTVLWPWRPHTELSLGETGVSAMLETIGSLGAAFIAADLGAAVLLLGLVVAVRFVGCAAQGRDRHEAM